MCGGWTSFDLLVVLLLLRLKVEGCSGTETNNMFSEVDKSFCSADKWKKYPQKERVPYAAVVSHVTLVPVECVKNEGKIPPKSKSIFRNYTIVALFQVVTRE